jgi:hypothetical protein
MALIGNSQDERKVLARGRQPAGHVRILPPIFGSEFQEVAQRVMAGHSTITLPGGFSEAETPIGFQPFAAHLGEATL